MTLFGKKKETVPASNAAGANETSQGDVYVKVLGSGCAKCNALEAAAKEALVSLGMASDIAHVTDFAEIAAYGVMATPALVLGNKVAASGRVLKKDEIVALLKKAGK